jgi:hypothetical protein
VLAAEAERRVRREGRSDQEEAGRVVREYHGRRPRSLRRQIQLIAICGPHDECELDQCRVFDAVYCASPGSRDTSVGRRSHSAAGSCPCAGTARINSSNSGTNSAVRAPGDVGTRPISRMTRWRQLRT